VLKVFSGMMRWVGHVTYMMEMRILYRKSENLKGRNHMGNLDMDVGIILKWILKT
jgi:hypothetical protein